MAGAVPDELLLARIKRESEARQAADAALEAALANATSEMKVKIDAVASKLSAKIGDKTVNSSALVGEVKRTQVEPGFALAEDLLTLQATVSDGQNTSAASVTELRVAMADSTQAFAQDLLTVRAQFNKNIAQVTDDLNAQATANSATANRVTTLESTVANPTTGLAASHARITNEETTRATAVEAVSTRTTALESSVNNPTTGVAATLARLVTEEQTRANADSAISTRTTTLESTVNSPTTGVAATLARLVTEEQTRATADTALSSRTTTLESSVNDASTGLAATRSRVTTIESTYATKTYAETKKSEAITASAADATAKVQTESTARATADGNLSGKYVVRVDANGRVAGMEITSSTAPNAGTTNEIRFTADAFKVFNGSSDVSPFSVVGGVVYLTNAVAETIKANVQITTPKIIGGKLELNGQCTVCTDQTAGIVRVNGGAGDGPGQGGQIDLLGSTYTTVPGYAGSVLLTPANVGEGTVRLRDRTGTDRVIVAADGDVYVETDLRTSGDIFLGRNGTTRWIYDANGNRVLNARYGGTPATLADVIAILQHHGLCN